MATGTNPTPTERIAACTCYLGHPDDPTADEEACAACDEAFWSNPVFILVEDGPDE